MKIHPAFICVVLEDGDIDGGMYGRRYRDLIVTMEH